MRASVQENQPDLDLVVTVLRGIRDPEQRAAWVAQNLPRTSMMLGLDWDRVSTLPASAMDVVPARRRSA